METSSKESTSFSSSASSRGEEALHTNGQQPHPANPEFANIKSVEDLKVWAKAHPKAATLSAFAIGVFIGVLLRR